jgi:hypothetical protein
MSVGRHPAEDIGGKTRHLHNGSQTLKDSAAKRSCALFHDGGNEVSRVPLALTA